MRGEDLKKFTWQSILGTLEDLNLFSCYSVSKCELLLVYMIGLI